MIENKTTIWKYELQIMDEQEIELPKARQILHIGEQNGKLMVWVLVNLIVSSNFISSESGDASTTRPEDGTEKVKFYIVGTGHRHSNDFFSKLTFCTTVPMSNGLVWHVFGDE